MFRNFNREHVTPKALILSVFGSMMPGTLVLFIGEIYSTSTQKPERVICLNVSIGIVACLLAEYEARSVETKEILQ